MSELVLPAVLRATVVQIHSLVNNYYQIRSHPLVDGRLTDCHGANQCVARGSIDVLTELDGSAARVVRGALHRQERGTPWFVEQGRLVRRGVLGRDALRGVIREDPARAEELIETVLLQHLVTHRHQGRRDE